MAIARICRRSSIALLVFGSLASLAMPRGSLGQAVGGSQGGDGEIGGALEQIHGSALGTITMPTLTELGILVAVGQSEQGRVFMLDAEMTSAIPGLFDNHTRVAFGSLYGELFEAPVGGAKGGQPPFEGVVEGMWRMDKSLEGSYEALVYERDGKDGLELVGRIAGLFRVKEVEAAVQGPVIGDAKASNANDHLGAVRPSKSGSDDGAAVLGGGPFEVHHHAKDVELSGATKLQFKILD